MVEIRPLANLTHSPVEADGSSAEMEVLFGPSGVTDWNHGGGNGITVNEETTDWRGTNDKGANLALSEIVWKNPSPDKTIATIDFISAQTKA